MLLKGKHALERAGQLLKELSKSQKRGAAKRSAMALSEDDASLLQAYLGRLGYALDEHAGTAQANLCEWLRSSPEILQNVNQEFAVWGDRLRVSSDHCLGVVRYLLLNPLTASITNHAIGNEHTKYFVMSQQLQFDARLLHEQLDHLGALLGFKIQPPDLIELRYFGEGDLLPTVDNLWGNWPGQEYFADYKVQQEIVDEWLRCCCDVVINCAKTRRELPRAWEHSEPILDELPMEPLQSLSAIANWLNPIADEVLPFRAFPDDADTRIFRGQRALRNVRMTLLMLRVEVPVWLETIPASHGDVEYVLEQLIAHLSELVDDTEGTLSDINHPPVMPKRNSKVAIAKASDEVPAAFRQLNGDPCGPFPGTIEELLLLLNPRQTRMHESELLKKIENGVCFVRRLGRGNYEMFSRRDDYERVRMAYAKPKDAGDSN